VKNLEQLAGAWPGMPPRGGAERDGREADHGICSLHDAVAAARASGLEAWALVGFAQRIVADRFTYSRRNPLDTPARAFERGQGYCQQQALALNDVYRQLGIDSRPVFATRCRFPPTVVHGVAEPGRISGHVWLRVRINGEECDICPGNRANTPGRVHFQVLSPVHELRPVLQPLTHLGSAIENARRDWLARSGQHSIRADIHSRTQQDREQAGYPATD
jgi:hypothetical protein